MKTSYAVVKRSAPAAAFFCASLALIAFSAAHPTPPETERRTIQVEMALMAEGVENLAPVNPGTEFSTDIGKVYCFSKITTSSLPARVKHLWFHDDRFVMEIDLPVESPSWRTYSSKTLVPSSTGTWRVDITDEDGTILKTLNFTIQQPKG